MTKTPTPIRGINSLQWIARTLWHGARQHKRASRPLTWKRLRYSLRPEIRRPIFIVGAPRSGTSFLGRCVAALPHVSYHFEPPATKAAARYVYGGAWPFEEASSWYTTTYRWLLRARLDGDARFAAKTPRNSFIIPFLQRTFPNAQFVHILRDGRDAAWSHRQKPWMQDNQEVEGRDMGGHPYGPHARFWVEPDRVDEFESTTTLHRCIWAWRRHVEAILDAKQELASGQYFELRYEEFVRQPEEVADSLLDFLNVADREARRALHAQATEAHTESIGRGPSAFTEEQQRIVDEEAGGLLRRLGYLPATSTHEPDTT